MLVREGARFDGKEARLPTAPVWFTKPHTTLIGHGAAVPGGAVAGSADEAAGVIDGTLRPALEQWMNSNKSISEAVVARP